MSKEVQVNKVKVPFYKKWWVTLIVGFVLGGIVFGSGGSSDSASDKITDEKPVTETTAKADTKSEPAKEEPKKVEKEPVTVFDNDKVKISFKEVNDEGVRFLVENKTDKPITIQADSIAINGFSVSSNDLSMSSDITAKSKGYADASTDQFSDVGTPEQISGSINVLDTESFETVANAHFTNVKVN